MATSRLRLTPGIAYLYSGSEGIYQVLTGQASEILLDEKTAVSGNLLVSGSAFLKNQASAPTPGGAEAVLYARAGTLYFKNSGGSETAVGGGGAGGSDTQVQFNDGGSSLGGDSGLTYNKITNKLTVSGDLSVNGAGIATTSTNFLLVNSNATTVGIGGAATNVSLGATTGTAWLKNANVYFSGSVYVSGSTRLGAAAADVTQVTGSFRSRQVTGSIYTVDGTTTFLKDGTNVTTTYDNTTGQWTIAATGGSSTPAGTNTQVQFNDGGSSFGGDAGLTYDKDTDTLTVAGDLAVNGGDITTTASTFNLVNANATTLKIGGGATDVSLGTTTGTAWLKNANVYFSGSVYVSGSTKLGDTAADVTEVTGSFKSRNMTGSIHTVNGSTPFITGSGAAVTFNNSAGQWTVAAGDVVGPASSLDNQIARFDLASGKLIQSSSITISDASVAGLVSMDTPGSVTSVNLFTSNASTLTIGKNDAEGNATVNVKLTADKKFKYNNELLAGAGVTRLAVSTVNSAALNGKRYVRFESRAANVTCNIPDPAMHRGRVITIYNDDDLSTVTITSDNNAQNAETVIRGRGNADNTYVLQGYAWIEICSDGTVGEEEWHLVCGGIAPAQPN